jgi:hypothetical protein
MLESCVDLSFIMCRVMPRNADQVLLRLQNNLHIASSTPDFSQVLHS